MAFMMQIRVRMNMMENPDVDIYLYMEEDLSVGGVESNQLWQHLQSLLHKTLLGEGQNG